MERERETESKCIAFVDSTSLFSICGVWDVGRLAMHHSIRTEILKAIHASKFIGAFVFVETSMCWASQDDLLCFC